MRAACIFLVLLLLLAFSPKKDQHPEHFVFDHEHAFSPDELTRLDTLFRGHELRTTNEIALITTTSYHGQPDLRSFAATCGDSLGVGKKRKNNGVIVVFSKKLREVFIATGLGTEQVMADARCKGFIDSLMIPLFKEDMYFDGVWAGSCAIVSHLEQPGNEIR